MKTWTSRPQLPWSGPWFKTKVTKGINKKCEIRKAQSGKLDSSVFQIFSFLIRWISSRNLQASWKRMGHRKASSLQACASGRDCKRQRMASTPCSPAIPIGMPITKNFESVKNDHWISKTMDTDRRAKNDGQVETWALDFIGTPWIRFYKIYSTGKIK